MTRPRSVVCCLLALACCAPAFDFTALRPQGYVSDFAGVLQPEERRQLEQYCARLEQTTGVQLALVTLRTLHGEPIEDVANALFRAWGIGRKATNEGALLLLAIGERRSRLEVGYGLEPILPDGYAGSILRAMRPELRAQRYGQALLIAASDIGSRVAQAKGVTLDAPLQARKQPPTEPPGLPWVLLLLPPAFLFWVLLRRGPAGRRIYRTAGASQDWTTALLLGALANRAAGYRRGGGGFGGFDSGDSFGGFGGGDSGGGGASSSW